MRLRWTSVAASDLENIYEYLTKNNPSFTKLTIRLLYEAACSLPHSPSRGRKGEMPGTRELILPRLPFIIVYRVTPEVVEIIRIFHGAQDRRSQ